MASGTAEKPGLQEWSGWCKGLALAWYGWTAARTQEANLNSTPERTATNEDEGSSPDLIAMPYLFILVDCSRPTVRPARQALDGVDVIRFGRGQERVLERHVEGGTCYLDVRVPDAWMSASHAHVVRGTEHWLFEDLSSKNGSLINGVRKERALLVELGHYLSTPADTHERSWTCQFV